MNLLLAFSIKKAHLFFAMHFISDHKFVGRNLELRSLVLWKGRLTGGEAEDEVESRESGRKHRFV